ncbi:MAG TPA: glycosyltransferase family 39 protein [Bryobacteraceae bacterium]|nr:glycosyltransferase family 39 protein [Bryobacteraceae bacterium]
MNGCFALGLALAAATLLAGWTAFTQWARSGRWLALALAGQAAALQLVDAGIRIHYQHYRLPAEAAADPVLRWMLLAVGLQIVLVACGLFRRRDAILPWCRSRRRVALVAAGIAACGCVAAAVSRDPRFYVAEVSLAAFIELVNAVNILLFAWGLPASGLKRLARWFDFVLGGVWPGPTAVDRFALLAALWVTTVSALLAWFVYQHHPHIADEVVYLYHARYFAAGKLVMPPPPVQKAFEVDLMEYRPDKWYAAPPMGWPAVLAIGAALGVPWLVNPILAGLNILLSYLLLGELYPRRIARVGVLLLCLSPWHVFMAMNYLTHTLTMTCALAAFLGVIRARRTGSAGWAWIAGAGVGVGSLIRPLEGLIVGALTAAWAIGIGGKRLKFSGLAALAAATVLTGALTLPYNKALVGQATASPIMRYTDEHYGHNSNAYGFGPDRGLGWATDAYPGHTPFESLINDELNGSSLNVELFGWSTGSLALMALLIFSRGLRRADYLMLAAILAVVIAYMPYWGNGGGDFGARYWYLVLLPCAALTARGLEWLESRLSLSDGNPVRATAAIAALCTLALVNYFPWRSLDKYYHYLRMRPDVQDLARTHGFGRSLVLIRGERFPDYASAAIYNPIDLKAATPVYAWDRNPAVRAEVLRVYADRPVWILEGPSITGAGYRIAAGPLNAGPRP